MGYPGAPPGWYADPAGGPGQRWWDGYAWTDTVVQPTPPPPSPPAPSPPAPSPPSATATASGYALPPRYVTGVPPSLAVSDQAGRQSAVEREVWIYPIARLAVTVPAIYYLVNLIIQEANRAQLRLLGHYFHRVYDATEQGRSAPPIPHDITYSPVNPLVLFLTIGAVVVACIWQHRATTAARAMGLPTTHTPAWGVGSWFVPIVNLWMPYQAIRDCLAPDDPNRRLVLQWWLALMATWSTVLAAQIAGYFSEGLGLAFSLPAGLCALALLATAPRVVNAITAAHRSRVGQATL
jgi:hypothetical protein